MSDDDGASRARDRRQAVPDRAERVTLAATFGVVLRLERRHWSQQELGDAAGLDRRSIDRLENGARRPSTVSVWRIARALRANGTVRDRVALDERLRQAAGRSLVWSNTRPHAGRERVRGELLAEAGGSPPVSDGDSSFGAVLLAHLAAEAAGAEDERHDGDT